MKNPAPGESAKPFGLTSAIALVIANMVGAGVFTTSGFSLGTVGNRHLVMAAWCVAGLIALCGALSYGGLARHITESGGEYLFLSRMVHPLAGFVAGWISLVVGFGGAIAFAAAAFAAYWQPQAPERHALIASGVVVFFALTNGLLQRVGVRLQNAIVAFKVAAIIGLVIVAARTAAGPGWPGLNADLAFTEQSFSFGAFAGSLMWISLSYSGFNAAVYITAEVNQPEANVPRALWIGTAIVFVLYLILNAVFLYGPEPALITNQKDIAAIAAGSVGGELAERFVRIAVCLALAGSVSSMIIAGPRVFAKMADDGFFPALFGSTTQNMQPAIWAQAGVALVFIAVSSLQDLLTYLSLVLSVCAAVTVAALLGVARRSGQRPCVPGYPWIPLLYVLSTLVLAATSVQYHWSNRDDSTWLKLTAALVTLGGGVIAYLFLRRKCGSSGQTTS